MFITSGLQVLRLGSWGFGATLFMVEFTSEPTVPSMFTDPELL